MKKCPYCAEEIQDDAVICRFCHSNLKTGTAATYNNNQPAPTVQPTEQQYTYNYSMSSHTKKVLLCCAALLINLLSSIGLFFDLFFMERLYDYKIYGISPCLAIDRFIKIMSFNWDELSDKVHPLMGFLALLCLILSVFMLIIIITFVKGLISISKAPDDCLSLLKNVSVINAVIYFGSIVIVIIWNILIKGAIFASSDYHSRVFQMEFPYAALVFGIISIVSVVIINQFMSYFYKIDKKDRYSDNNS